MKILFAVMSAETYIFNGMDDLIRQTWGKDAAQYGDFRFFCGRGDTVLPSDYVRVDAPDDKDNLIYKVVEMCWWVLDHGYDYMLKTDIDTYVVLHDLSSYDDYLGAPVGTPGKPYGDTGAYGFIQGSAMWLSRDAMNIIAHDVVDTMVLETPKLMKANGIISPYPHSEDLWIGMVLGPHIQTGAIKARCINGYSNGPLTYHFAICHSTCTQEEWRARLEKWFTNLHEGNFSYHESR
jgi:hypothetical protein